ncbi:MAG TPA: ATP-dependent helicase [Verrucomicrobiales bacterium]|nr:ATP-dependent helicase [Verrucomicrobiales bacterium]
MMTFTHSIQPESVRLSAKDEKGIDVPLKNWLAHTAGASQVAAVRLRTLLDSGSASLLETGELEVPNTEVVEIPEQEALALGLPPRSAFTLNVENQGVISEPTFSITCRFNQPDGRPVITHRQGAFVRTGTRWWRLPASHYHLVDATERISRAMAAGDLDERMRAYATLRNYLPDDPTVGVTSAPLLRQFQVYDAGAFSLKLRIQQGRLTFDPVLYARKPGRLSESGEEVEGEPPPLLPDASSDAFAKMLSADTGRYALGGNRFLVLTPELKKAMTTVKRLRDGSKVEAQQRLFLKPATVLREEFARDLGDEGLDEMLESLFLETKDYLSDRIIGIGIWQKPVLPWIQKRGNDWFPPEEEGQPPATGLRIETESGPVDLPLGKVEARNLHLVVERAISVQQDFVEHAGQRIPATSETLKALVSVIDPPKKEPSDSTGRMALLIDGHYETVASRRGLTPRSALTQSTLPAGLRSGLKEHQIQGLRWMQDAWKDGMPGVLLADDMGLGKTLQALAFLLWQRENSPSDPSPQAGGCLIVAPTALLLNWKAEHDKHLDQPGLGDVLQVHGSHLRHARRADGQGLDSDKLRRAAWVLTTYETLKGYQQAFAEVRFRCVVMDEAQKIKSPDTQVTDAAKSLNADFKIAMTGTPVENRRADLWCVSDAVYPGLLGSLKEFSAAYEKDETLEAASKLKNLITTSEAGGETPQAFMLRRMKDEILEGLPEKKVETRQTMMPDKQAQLYHEVITSSRGEAEPGAKLKALHALRLVSLHPWLVSDDPTESAFDLDGFMSASARIQMLDEILGTIRQRGEKALLFVNSRRMQKWLRLYLANRYQMPDVALINGTTPAKQREDMVNACQSAPPGFGLMLLSPKAAGVGFTITAANHVIHLERWWNPAVEDQCTDRAYRIGQNKPVTVWLPQAKHPDPAISDHSFDLRLHDLLEHKRRLSRDLLCPVEDAKADGARLFAETVSEI